MNTISHGDGDLQGGVFVHHLPAKVKSDPVVVKLLGEAAFDDLAHLGELGLRLDVGAAEDVVVIDRVVQVCKAQDLYTFDKVHLAAADVADLPPDVLGRVLAGVVGIGDAVIAKAPGEDGDVFVVGAIAAN